MNGIRRAGQATCALVFAGGIALVIASRVSSITAPPPAPTPAATFTVDRPASPHPTATRSCASLGGKNRVVVPSLHIAASHRPTSFTDGMLDLPHDVHLVASLAGRAPGDSGSYLLAGHVDAWNQGRGAFWPLFQVSPRADVWVSDDHCRVTRWSVTSLRAYVKADLPASMFATTGPPSLVLVTCGGPVVHGPNGFHYRDNVVVTAAPAG